MTIAFKMGKISRGDGNWRESQALDSLEGFFGEFVAATNMSLVGWK